MGKREIEISGHKLTIHELDDVYDSVTGRPFTGSWVWDSALVLARWLAASQLDFSGRSVLELGAGEGIPGLTAAKLGASRVVLTDVAPLLPGLLQNVEANGLGERVEVRELVWGAAEEEEEEETAAGGGGGGGELGEFDVVLMSDVFFGPEEMAALGTTLKRVCRKGTEVLAASEVRCWIGECLNELASRGFAVVELLPSQLAAAGGGSCGDDRVADMFAVYRLIPLDEEEYCHVDDMSLA